jgi:hypothetical protein
MKYPQSRPPKIQQIQTLYTLKDLTLHPKTNISTLISIWADQKTQQKKCKAASTINYTEKILKKTTKVKKRELTDHMKRRKRRGNNAVEERKRREEAARKQ